ncbi:type VII secretion protein EccB [Mycolicibacterium flavescens]|uniref:Type VII secretion protein EccB n=1 Tax=Mycolicibacterium flavescens TaxID=1776 RepID=A0A1E3RLC0_MYCFV|nr:type VII secretion protein EccB [Mycolicibacterium flavescens]MCV7281977.1 type VII secretion protein EccB [Mycolicibacterium flavescens]ODQ90659.1 type VII secretion protein EccB [Mycolicibacterium flavescens]
MAENSSKLQISGQRFLIRRMTHALVRGDVRMHDDPLRAQSISLTVGCVLAAIAIGVCAVLAYLKPRGALGDAPVVMVRDSGALYVRVDDTLHPVPNLASARLIVGTPAVPRLVSRQAVETASRGPAVGIPGAPDVSAAPLSAGESSWQICEDAASTTVFVGAAEATSAGSVLVAPRDAGAAETYLLYDGRRARVDLRSPAVVRALKLDGVEPRPVSRTLLDTVPEAAQITAPAVPDAGTAGPATLHGFAVGTVLRVPRAGAVDLYVVLASGVQRVGEVAADLIRFTRSHGERDIVTVEPAAIGAVPVVDDLAVAGFPQSAGLDEGAVICVRWRSSGSASVEHAVSVADALPTRDVTRLAQADAEGPAVDAFALTHGRNAFVRAAGVTGDGAHGGPLYLVSDAGVVYGLRDPDAATRLGLTGDPVPAPWPLLARLPRGPELSVQEASVARDSLPS